MLRNNLFLDDLSCTHVLTYLAVLADLGIDHCVLALCIDRAVRAVCLTVAASDTCGITYFSLVCIVSSRRAGNELHALVRNHGDQAHRTCICTILTSHTLVRVNLGYAVNHCQSTVTAGCCTSTLANTACGTQTQLLAVNCCCLSTGLDAHLFEYLGSSAAAASYESNLVLEDSQVVECINDNLLLTFYGTCNAAFALLIVDNRMVIHDGNSTLRAGTFALAAGDTAVAACLAYDLIILLCGRAGDEVGSIRRDHADNMLRTGSSIRAGTTAVALLGVNDHFTVFEAHCAIFTDIDTGTNAYTSALALSALEALVNSLLAGRTAGESCFAGSMSSAADEGNLLGYFHRSYAQKLADGIDSILIACGTEGSISGLSDSLCTFRTACFSAATQTTAIETGQKRQNLSDESLGLVVIGTHMKSSFY